MTKIPRQQGAGILGRLSYQNLLCSYLSHILWNIYVSDL